MARRLQVDLKDLEREIEALAQQEDRSLGAMCRVLIAEALEARNTQNLLNPAQIRRSLSSLPSESLVSLAQEAFHQILGKVATDVTAAEFVKALVRGKQPSSQETAELARSLDLSERELLEMCDRLFSEKT